MFDKDDSGFIDRTELAMVLQLTGEKLNKNEIDTVFNTMDANGDGMINYEGASSEGGGAAGWKGCNTMDANGDAIFYPSGLNTRHKC